VGSNFRKNRYMKKHQLVRIIKLGPSRIPATRSIEPGYEVEGALMEDIVPGSPVYLLRTKTNGRKALGLFETSPVTIVVDGGFETENSIYTVEEIKADINDAD